MGIILGFLLLGPAGIIIGFILGLLLDQYFHSVWNKGQGASNTCFFNATFKVMGYLAKADGRVSEQAIQAARDIMRQMKLSEQQCLKAIALFNQGKKGNINLAHDLSQLRRNCYSQPALLRLFLELQFQAALADGYIRAGKQAILQQICQQLGFAPINFADVGYHQHQYGHQHRHQQHSYQSSYQPTRSVRSMLDEAYAVLNIASTATNVEVKKAYRRLISQHHPDKLVAKGLSEAMLKVATEKTQRIQAAYDQICKGRGM